jgi:sarcosine oxidase, subunit gamma
MAEAMTATWFAEERGIGVGKLRTLAADAAERLSDTLGFAAPEAGRMTSDDRLVCMRLGPHEWIILGPIDAVSTVLARLGERFAGETALVLDMTHGAWALRLSGNRAVERIAAYCELDLRPAAFPIGSATRTRFGDVAVTLARIDDEPSFWLIADQSHADYLRLLFDHGVTDGAAFNVRSSG